MPKIELSPEKAAKEWIELRVSQKEIEKRLSEIKPVLEKALRKAPEKTQWGLVLVDISRPTFALKKALEKLDRKILAPFISKSKYAQIRPAHEAKEAA